MTQQEKQKKFHAVIANLKRTLAFAEAMANESVTPDTALSLMQLAEAAHKSATIFRTEMIQDLHDRIR